MSRALLAAALAALSLVGVDAEACVRSTVQAREGQSEGPCLWWGIRTIEWKAHERGSSLIEPDGSELEAIRRSFQTWAGVECSDMAFVELPPTPRFDVGFDPESPDNLNLIVFRDRDCRTAAPGSDPCWTEGGCNNKFNCWEESTETIAVTTTFFSNRTGEIFDGDIELNGAGFDFTTADGPACAPNQPASGGGGCVSTDVENTVTHELGHFLGLDHSPVIASTMYRSADVGETSKRSLHADDVDCFCAIYPKNGPTLTCIAPADEVVVGDGCGCGTAAGGASLLGAVLALGTFARRRRTLPPPPSP